MDDDLKPAIFNIGMINRNENGKNNPKYQETFFEQFEMPKPLRNKFFNSHNAIPIQISQV